MAQPALPPWPTRLKILQFLKLPFETPCCCQTHHVLALKWAHLLNG